MRVRIVSMARSARAGRKSHQAVGLYLGAALAVLMLLVAPPEGLSVAGWRTAALGVCMGTWWATEALPVAATALLPIGLFPVLGIADIKAATAPYANSMIYLFLGGFMVALAIQRWNLHRRIALGVITVFGGSGASLVGGFMVASALVSMWVTNTATTMMLLPIAVSVVLLVQKNLPECGDAHQNFSTVMLLGVAYGATIGGMATLVGTPPNALLAGFMQENYGVEIGFGQWMLIGVPLAVTLLPISWWLLTHRLYPVRFSTSGESLEHLRRLRRDLGPMSRPEKRVAGVFLLLAFAWIGRPFLTGLPGLGGLSDAGLAILAALTLFLIPSGSDEARSLMHWGDTSDLPWGVLLLFGGGLTLAAAVSSTGLAAWLGTRLTDTRLTGSVLLIVALAALVIFLTELTSNLATTATFLPVVAAVAVQSGWAPIALTAPVALAASCAFMLPVATPPNAIVYGSGMLTIPEMARAGFWLNLIGVVLVSLVAIFLAPMILS